MTNSRPFSGRLRPRLAGAAALLAAATFLAACGGATTDTPQQRDEQVSNPARDEALSFQNLPWMPTADPSRWPLGPLTDMAQNEANGTWTMALGPDGYRVTNSADNGQNLFLRRSMDGPAPPGYRATAYLRVNDLKNDEAAAGLIFATASPQEMVIVALNGDDDVVFYSLDGGQLSEPTSLNFSGDIRGTDHMLQAIITGNKAALFVEIGRAHV